MGSTQKLLRLKHSGRLGDIVYALMAIKPYADRNDLKIEFALWNNPALKNQSDEGHMYPGGVNQAAFDFVKMYLEYHGCEATWYDGQKPALDLDIVKFMGQSICLPYSDIRKWYMFAYPDLNVKNIYYTRPESARVDKNYVVVNRTKRWQNIHIDYTALKNFPFEVRFIGSIDEYEEFKTQVPEAVYCRVDNLYEANFLMANSRMFIGNQSLFYAVAEVAQIPRMLEVCPYAPNVISHGYNAYDFCTQAGFEYYLGEIL